MRGVTGRSSRWPAVGGVLVCALALALGAAGCGGRGARPAGGSKLGSSAGAAVTVSPSTGLVAGQRLQVRLEGFPRHATVAINECARGSAPGVVKSCAGSAITILYTGTTGTASGPFVVEPAVSAASGRTVRCRDQCVLAGVVIKHGNTAPRKPAPIATARLSFSASATPGLADEFLQQLSWASPAVGWALASQPCDTGTCVRLAHTTDGGRGWHALPDPPVRCSTGIGSFNPACVSEVSFASPAVGYLYGAGLLMTTDGGTTWHPLPGPEVESLTIVAGEVWRVAYRHTGCPGPCDPFLQKAKVGSRAWRTVIAQLATPGRSGSSQIVASGSTMLLALYGSQAGPVSAQATVYRSTNAGVTWQRQRDPCAGKGPGGRHVEEDLNNLTAARGGFFAGVCSPHAGSGIFVITSTDTGLSWQKSGSVSSVLGSSALITAASPTTLAISTGASAGAGPYTPRLLLSTDAGNRWRTVATDPQQLTQEGAPAWLGFQSPRFGSWLADPHAVWSTADGGANWTKTAFR